MDGATGLSSSRINSYFQALNSCYKFLIEGYEVDNPVLRILHRYVPNPSNYGYSYVQLISMEEISINNRLALAPYSSTSRRN